MMLIRPISHNDLASITTFSSEALIGMTSLPKDREKLKNKIASSEKSFQSSVDHPGKEEYYFVMEESSSKEIGGTCGILADSTSSFTHYYEIESSKCPKGKIPTPDEMKLLKVAPNRALSSEICALFLRRSFRKSGYGRLLALSRFLFIAAFPERFKSHIVAELRGYLDEQRNSPFWDAVGDHFCSLSFLEFMDRFDEFQEHLSEI